MPRKTAQQTLNISKLRCNKTFCSYTYWFEGLLIHLEIIDFSSTMFCSKVVDARSACDTIKGLV